MSEHLLEIRIVQPGRAVGQYYASDPSSLRLEKVIYTDHNLPVDVGILPTALSPFDEPLSVLVLGGISHPVNTELEARLLGGVQRASETPFLLAAPTADERAPQCLESVHAGQRADVLNALDRARPGNWHWLGVGALEPYLHAAALRYRQKQADGRLPHLDPGWQPIHVSRPPASFAEAERYTAAEYTFYELPYRFQHYVSEHLAPDERILYALRRPAMESSQKHSWLRHKHLQAGVLILTTQRLIHLAELAPLDSANIRYGFHAAVGVLERLAEVSLSSVGTNLSLQTEWHASGGKLAIEWESADHTGASIGELVALLDGFQSRADTCALRRATAPAPPEILPPLTDAAASDPGELIPINEFFSATLADALTTGEEPRAWAFLPKWFSTQKAAQALVITDQRILVLPDRAFELPLGQVATLEYTGSILESSLAINFIRNRSAQRKVIPFPYPAQASFRNCFEAARRCMAVLPLV